MDKDSTTLEELLEGARVIETVRTGPNAEILCGLTLKLQSGRRLFLKALPHDSCAATGFLKAYPDRQAQRRTSLTLVT